MKTTARIGRKMTKLRKSHRETEFSKEENDEDDDSIGRAPLQNNQFSSGALALPVFFVGSRKWACASKVLILGLHNFLYGLDRFFSWAQKIGLEFSGVILSPSPASRFKQASQFPDFETLRSYSPYSVYVLLFRRCFLCSCSHGTGSLSSKLCQESFYYFQIRGNFHLHAASASLTNGYVVPFVAGRGKLGDYGL